MVALNREMALRPEPAPCVVPERMRGAYEGNERRVPIVPR
jgi:hypothetical protein